MTSLNRHIVFVALAMAVALPAAAEPRTAPVATPTPTPQARQASGGATDLRLHDLTNAYNFGGVPRGSTTVTFDAPTANVKDVTFNADPEKLLGCDAIDSGKLVIDSLNNSQYVDEVVGQYPNTELFRRMAQLMLQSPSLVGAIQATLTAGNNRAKLMADRCRTAETMADARNVRLREEARRLCLSEKTGPERLNCLSDQDNTTLKQFITRVANEPRWNKDFHTVVCQMTNTNGRFEPDKECFWTVMLPNIKFDPVTGESEMNVPAVSADRLFEFAEQSTTKILEERVTMIQDLIFTMGYDKVSRGLAARTDLDAGPEDYTALQEYIVKTDTIATCGSGGTSMRSDGTTTVSRTDSVVARDDFILLMSGTSAQNEKLLNKGGLRAAGGSSGGGSSGGSPGGGNTPPDLNFAQNLERLKKVTVEGAKCIASREIHGHVDLKLAQLQEGDRKVAINSLAQAIAAKTVIGILNAVAVKLEDILAQRGNLENSNSAVSLSPDMQNFLRSQIQSVRGRLDQMRYVSSNFGDVTARVASVNKLHDENMQRANQRSSAVFATTPVDDNDTAQTQFERARTEDVGPIQGQ